MITSYGHGGRLSALSTRVVNAPTASTPETEARCIVGFHLKAKPSADEAAMRGAGCKIETVDESGSPIALQADLHFFYPVSTCMKILQIAFVTASFTAATALVFHCACNHHTKN